MSQQRDRQHKLILDLFDWEHGGSDYRITLTIDEGRLADVIGKAIARHDGKTELAAGGIVIEAQRLGPTAPEPCELFAKDGHG